MGKKASEPKAGIKQSDERSATGTNVLANLAKRSTLKRHLPRKKTKILVQIANIQEMHNRKMQAAAGIPITRALPAAPIVIGAAPDARPFPPAKNGDFATSVWLFRSLILLRIAPR
ncbi:MAG: hypothetical protein EBT13_10205 [Rhodobacteraceae bacterium]|nr:hypothetical protein [Paracoccaceae bacterium]